MIKYLLDTDISIYIIKRKPHGIRRQFNVHAGEMAISSVTVAELLFGAENSSSPAENKRIVDGFVQRLHVLDFDQAAATQYAQIRIELKRKSIGAYDVMLAAQARSRGLILVTNNIREFDRVDGLRLENWVKI